MTTTVARTRRERLAHLVTELSSPALCVVVGLVLVAWDSAAQGFSAAWVAAAIVLCAGVPMAVIAKGVKSGRWEDHHVVRRDQRYVPLLVAVASVATATVLLILVRAPRELIALVVAQLGGLLVVLAVTRFWKVSIHCATAAGLLGVLLTLYGPWALLGLSVLALILWSRVVLDAHSWAQATVGSMLGFVVAIGLFPLLR